jgi:hypothetical protein
MRCSRDRARRRARTRKAKAREGITRYIVEDENEYDDEEKV